MYKNIWKRFMVSVLVVLMLMSFFPGMETTAYAENVSTGVTGLTAVSSGGAWSVSGSTITGSVQATKGSGCNAGYTAGSDTLTFTNNSGAVGQLSFDYTLELNKGSATVDGVNVTEGASFSKTLSAGDTVDVTITSNSQDDQTATIAISNLKLTPEQDVEITFKAPLHGSYTVDGTAVTAQTVKTVKTTDSVALSATAASGYKFFGWKNETTGSYLSNSAAFTTSFTEDTTVFPEFVAESVPVFQVGSMLYTDLNEAISYAQTSGTAKITLVSNGTLPAGNYTIPSGKTLLIPFDEAQTVYTSTPEVVYAEHVNPSAFRTMTMASGATITVASGGALCVPSKLSAYGTGSGSWNGTPTGKHGRITMNAGSAIEVQSGGTLYAYGYISGSGNVYARSGSEIWECFQIRCWRGGTATSGMADNSQKVFPLNQYYVQNIEAPVTYYAGATEKVYTAVNMSSKAFSASATFIGSGGMFQISNGSATKRFTGASDRLELSIDGNFEVTPMSLRITGLPLIGTLDLNTSDYVLPIQSNITLNVNSGTTTISQDVAFLPGSEMSIANGATVTLASGHKAYVYDKTEWGAYAATGQQLVVVGYSTVNGTTAKRNAASLVDAKINVNGTLDLAGNLYTTESGAAIVSIGETGKAVLTNAPGTETNTYQATQSGSDMTYVAIPITPAQLQNGDGTYVQTSDLTAGTEVPYSAANHAWSRDAQTFTVKFNKNADDAEGEMEDQTIIVGEKGILNENKFTRAGYTFKGWAIQQQSEDTYEDKFTFTAEQTTALYQMLQQQGVSELTLYAQWEEAASYTVTWKNGDTVLEKDENVAAGTTPSYDGETPIKAETAQYSYTFKGWSAVENPGENDEIYTADTLPAVTDNVTYYAQFTETVNKYTVTWKNEDGTVLEKDENVRYNAQPSYDGETPTKAEDDDFFYTFDGWVIKGTENVVDLETERVTEDVTYTAHFAAEAKIAITFLPGTPDGATVTGEMPVQKIRSGVDTALNENAFQIEGYTFLHWTDGTKTYNNGETVNFTADTTLTAVWEKNKYTVTLHSNYGEDEPDVNAGIEHGSNFTIPQHQFDRTGYTLIGWSEDPNASEPSFQVTGTIQNVTRNYDLYAVWQIKTYTITLKANYEGGVDPEPLTVQHGGTVTLPTPDREGYSFACWNTSADGKGIGYDAGEPIGFTADTTLYAQWTPNKYKITFKNGNETLETYQVAYGMMPAYNGAEPTKAETDQYSYTFAGWSTKETAGENDDIFASEALPKVTGDTTYFAQFSQSVNEYTVTFYNEDGTSVLCSHKFAYGTHPVYEGQEPAKTGNAQYSYIFSGWRGEDSNEYGKTDELPAVTGTCSYTAVFTSETNKYTVIWEVDGVTVEADQNVEYGATPSFDGTTPTKTATAEFEYEFKGWSINGTDVIDIAKETVKGDVTYKAVFEATTRSYTVTWIVEDKTVETDENVPYGEKPAYNGETPVKDPTAAETYTFSGWKDLDGNVFDPNTSTVKGDTVYTAQFTSETRTYTITFKDGDGKVLQSTKVPYGQMPVYAGAEPTKTATAEFSYTWNKGWDPALKKVEGEATYTATFDATKRSYTVTWIVENKTVETDENVPYGEKPSYDSATPEKAATEAEVFTFKGWVKNDGTEVVNLDTETVTGDVTYTATFTHTPRMYSIKFVDYKGELLDTGEFAYGTRPVYKGNTPEQPADNFYTYEFAGWTTEGSDTVYTDDTLPLVSGEATYKASFQANEILYTVTWLNWNGDELDKQTYRYGETPALTEGKEPVHENSNPAKFTYTFAGWIVNGDENNVVKEFGSVEANVTYKAKFTESINVYEIRFVDEANETLWLGSFPYDTNPTYGGQVPVKEGNAQFSYTFNGWLDKEETFYDKDATLPTVTENAVYKVSFLRETKSYTITFKDGDGKVLQRTEVPYGQMPVYAGVEPTKTATAEFSYTWNNDWDPALKEVDGEATYTATFDATKRSYLISFVDEDGETLLWSKEFEYGTMPEYGGDKPTKAATAEFSYTFAGWDPELTEVTGAATYTATYEEAKNSYTVTFKNWDGNVLKSTEVPYGEMPVYAGNTPTRSDDEQYQNYVFQGWTPALAEVTGPAVYTAVFKGELRSYTVTFKNWDDKVLQSTEVPYGEMPVYAGNTPTRPDDEQYKDYAFQGWDKQLEVVTGEAVYTAQFAGVLQTYTVTWVVDGEPIETDTGVAYNTVPSYDGNTPVKASDAQYDYEFIGWEGDITKPITGNTTFNAVFKFTTREYTVTWVNDVKDENGEYIVLEKDEKVPYGEKPSYDGATPVKDADQQYSYTFADKWVVVGNETVALDDDYTVSGDVTFRACYNTVIQKYTVTWVNEDGTVLETDEDVPYGTTPTYDGATPTKADTAQYSYTFKEWTPAIAAVTGDVTYTATYTETVNKYTVTWKNGETVLLTKQVEYGATPEYEGDDPVKEETLTHSYQFTGWNPVIVAVTGDAEYVAVFEETAKNGWIRWTDGIYYVDHGEIVTGVARVAYPEDSSFGYAEPEWDDAFDSGHPTDGKGTFLFAEDGKLQTAINGFYSYSEQNEAYPTDWLAAETTVWAVNGEIVWHPGLVTDGTDYYYFNSGNVLIKNCDYSISKTNDLAYTEDGVSHSFVKGSKYTFDQDGKIQLYNGFVDIGDTTYYYVYGAKTYAGLIKVGDDYYYVKSDCSVVKGRSYYVSRTNDLLPAGVYTFDADGKMIIENLNGIKRDENGVLRYYVDGAIQKGSGVVYVDGNYYYVNGSGVVISGRDYAITKTNNMSYTKADGTAVPFVAQKTYSFDENGVMLLNDGFVDVGSVTYYYQNGAKTYAGLIKVGEDYYYVKSDCTVVKDRSYYVSKTNGLMAAGSYVFDADGKMVVPNDGGFTGFKEDSDGVLRYYKKDILQKNLGLIQVDGNFYYINGSGVVINNCDYALSNTNGLSFTKNDGSVAQFQSGKVYTFDKNGVLQLFDGITEIGGKKFYYVDAVKTYAGLIQIDGDFYYVKSNCELVVNSSYYVSKTNGLKPAGQYSFDANGKMI